MLYDVSDLRFDQDDLVLDSFFVFDEESGFRLDRESLRFLCGSD